jgi:hypothetical protein
MVQTRENILAALAHGPRTTAQLMEELDISKSAANYYRKHLEKDGLVEGKGTKALDQGFGCETIWGLVTAKKAINAFDWRNWETQCHQSAREIAFSHSQFERKNDGRVIVYSRA